MNVGKDDPLNVFSQEQDLECIKILIAIGADITATDQQGKTPLDLLSDDITDTESSNDTSRSSIRANINATDQQGKTPLDLVSDDITDTESSNDTSRSSIGTNINATDQQEETPLDLLNDDITDAESSNDTSRRLKDASTLPPRSLKQGHSSVFKNPTRKAPRQEIIELLKTTGGLRGKLVDRAAHPSRIESFPLVPLNGSFQDVKQRKQVLRWAAQLTTQYSELERNIREWFRNTSHAGETQLLSSNEAVPLAMQLNEMEKFKQAGSRILCLDGGGIRGLIQLEVLSQLERKTGRRITELFDWIIGTSTGGIIALGLVYGTDVPQLIPNYVIGHHKSCHNLLNFKPASTCSSGLDYPQILPQPEIVGLE